MPNHSNKMMPLKKLTDKQKEKLKKTFYTPFPKAHA